jgi:competence protein ComFA
MKYLITYSNTKCINSINIDLSKKEKCPICGSHIKATRYISQIKSNVHICKECLNNEHQDKLFLSCSKYIEVTPLELDEKIKISLTSLQEKVCKSSLKTSRNVLIDAVCGSGKSNIILKVILELHTSNNILFVCPRRKLVEDFYKLFYESFGVKPAIITGTEKSSHLSSVALCTSKMLHKIPPTFNVVIFDEVDAFPYFGSQYASNVLKNFIKKSNARLISLSATANFENPFKTKIIKLNQRYHGNPLPVPKVINPNLIELTKYINKRILLGENILLFCPSISEQFDLYRYFVTKVNCFMINSKMEKEKQDQVLVIFSSFPSLMITTTLLERGVTYPKVSVIVYNASSNVYNEKTLIQIAGRVNRIESYQNGEIYFMSNIHNKSIKTAIRAIKQKNRGIK